MNAPDIRGATPSPQDQLRETTEGAVAHKGCGLSIADGGPTELDTTDRSNGIHTDGDRAQVDSITTDSTTLSKKRKRVASPPWQFPTAEATTLKTADGRRASARFHPSNSATPALSENENHSRLQSRATSSRLSSPPWKEFKADGPTSLQVDGIRKSGRVNKDLSTQPKRVSPRSKKQVDKLGDGGTIKVGKMVEEERQRGRKRTSSVLKETDTPDVEDQPRIDRRTKAWRDSQQHASAATSNSKAIRRVSLEQPAKAPPRIKLRVNSARNLVPPPHPYASFTERMHPPQVSIWQLLEDVDLRELQHANKKDEEEPPSRDDFERRRHKMAEQESIMRHRIVEAAKPQGVLSEDKCSIYRDSVIPCKIPQVFGHIDHLSQQVIFFRDLQKGEAHTHRQNAKKYALACQAAFEAKFGVLDDENRLILADKTNHIIYKQVMTDLKAKWVLVDLYVQEKRKATWEAEQEAHRREKLEKQLAWSENMVARQRGELDSDDEELGIDSNGDDDNDDDDDDDEMDDESDDNMSEESSEDEATEHIEESMDDDTLQAYLAQRDAEPPDKQSELAALLPVNSDPEVGAADEDDSLLEHSVDERRESSPSNHEAEGVANHQEVQQDAAAALALKLDDDGHDLSEEESVDMDSEDYDSDEDMSDSDASDGAQSASSEERGGLLGFFSKSQLRAQGLPTPVTSAEGDHEREHMQDVVNPDEASTAESIETQAEEQPLQETSLSAVQSPRPATPSSQSPSDAPAKQLIPQPTLLRGTLRSYQHAGVDWLASLYRNGTNGILADEMGLGKTIQTISLFAHLAEQHDAWDTHLVIVPTSVILNWVTEFQKFLPGFRVLGYYGSTEERHAKRRGWVNDPHHEIKDKRGYNVIVTSYNIALKDINAIRHVQWHYMVLDEAHNIRNFNSQRFQNLIKLKTRARLLLTGTPLQNSLTELWSLLTFLTAGRDDGEATHGGLEEFLARWKEPVNEIFERGVQSLSEEATKVVGQLHTSLRPFMLRRLKADVEKDLPKKTEHVVVCKLSKRQRQLYQDYMGLSDTRAKLKQGNAISAGKVLLSLRRVCNHPDLFDPRHIQTSYAMETSPVGLFLEREAAVRRLLDVQEPPRVMLLTPLENEQRYRKKRGQELSGVSGLRQQVEQIQSGLPVSLAPPDTVADCRAWLNVAKMRKRMDQLRDSIRYTEAYYDARPIYGSDLRELFTIRSNRKTTGCGVLGQMQITTDDSSVTPALLAKSEVPFDRIIATSSIIQQNTTTVQQRADDMYETITRFAFCTPEVTAPILSHLIPGQTQKIIRADEAYPLHSDPAHEARMRTSIVFPDSRLLVYDAGKLQRLTVLLRELQAKGSRSLIFTQMSGTLNILEQFLGLMGLPYLRLDGSTPVERRALYSTEFNRPDSKYQCMILSSRAGGVGLNLTGASSVIFYDLDWNPQMDKQCMDRAHRIGQVRDVEVFKLVSEKTVEENILRRANQKSLLDQTVIQQGHFTTEHGRNRDQQGGDDDVAAAIDRFLSGGDKAVTKTIESVEDKEDVQAAQQARKEEMQDEEDFAERSSKGPSVPPTPGLTNAETQHEADLEGHIDSYIIRVLESNYRHVPYVPPKEPRRDRSHKKKGQR